MRNPVVAGQFYPGSRTALLKEIKSLVDPKARREDAIGVISPHAGYMYSGPVAGSVLSSITAKSTYIIMGPNHTGLGGPFGISAEDSWKTPLGDVQVDEKLASQIKSNSGLVKDDDLSHSREHSIEVQLPFLQFMQKDFKFVAITISCASLGAYRDIGKSIAKSIKELGLQDSVTIIASSDMTHYESQEAAKRKDLIAIDAVLKLDEEKLIQSVAELDITMCGYAPVAIMIIAAKELGAKKARLVRYETSGDVTGDYSSVVGYAGIVVD